MTPAARAAAAIEVLDQILAGRAVEPALTHWARAHRFAGSGDRQAIRDWVFAALRRRRSAAALGGAESGRGLVLGLVRGRGEDPAAIFGAGPHAPPALGPDDRPGAPPQGLAALDCPDWLGPVLQASLGAAFAPSLRAMQERAPVFLRVNLARGNLASALAALAEDSIAARPVPGVATALEVTENARRLTAARAYLTGLVELQDAASQALVLDLPLRAGMRVLDHCAGGGGKSLAMAARAKMTILAHDANPRRMTDIAPRAARAGAKIALCPDPAAVAPFDLVLADVPCSGSGSWRRDPMGKWALTPERLAELTRLQAQILDEVAPLVRPGGHLAYATCALIAAENTAQVAAFLTRHPGWAAGPTRQWLPSGQGDGFFLALLTAPSGRPKQP